MAYEVEVIKASRKITDRKTGGLSDILRVAPYARVSTDTEGQLKNYKSQVSYYSKDRYMIVIIDLQAVEYSIVANLVGTSTAVERLTIRYADLS